MGVFKVFNRGVLFYAAAFVIAAATIQAAYFIYGVPSNSLPIHGEWSVSHTEYNKSETYSIPFYSTAKSSEEFDSGIYTLTTTFTLPRDIKKPVLVVPQISANAFSVYINSQLVGRVGDMHKGRTNRWNTPHTFTLPETIEKGPHTITIRAYALYELGISFVPYFHEGSTLPLQSILLIFFNNHGTAFVIGALLVLSLIFVITARTIETENKHRILLAFALLGLAIYLIDYLFIPLLPYDYYIFKKIPLSGLYIAILFSIPGFFGYQNRKLSVSSKIVMLLPLVSLCVIILYPSDIFQVREVYKYANLSLIPYIVLMHASHLHRRDTDNRSRLIIFGLTFLTILALRDVVQIINGSGTLVLSYIGISVFLLTLTFAFINEMAEYYTQLVKMEQWADAVYQESMHDPLTGALNRKAFTVLKKLRPEKFSIIILDLDDFKAINDTYGHHVGDQMLKEVANTLIQNIRKSDYLVRLGGDEFAVILFGCDIETAHSSANALLQRIQEIEVQCESTKLHINCSMGVGTVPVAANVDERMVAIDQYMYQAKRSGKGRIVVEKK